MKQFLIFAQGALKMLVAMALLITCIGAIVSKDGVFVTTGIISLVTIVYNICKVFKDMRNN